MNDNRYSDSQATLNRALLVLKACEPSRLKRKLHKAWADSVRDMATAIVMLQSIRSDQLLQHHTLECYVEAVMVVDPDDLVAAHDLVRVAAAMRARDSEQYRTLMDVAELLRMVKKLDPPRSSEFPPLPTQSPGQGPKPDIGYQGPALIERRQR